MPQRVVALPVDDSDARYARVNELKAEMAKSFRDSFGSFWDTTCIDVQKLTGALSEAAQAFSGFGPADPATDRPADDGHQGEECAEPAPSRQFTDLHRKFFNEMDIELARVSSVYHETAMQLKSVDEKGRWFGRKNMRMIPRSFTSLRVGRGFKVAGTVEQIYVQSVLCSLYAQLHREVVREILALHDDLLKSNSGSKYLEMVWMAGDNRGLFLHSALLRELEALQEIMVRKLGEARAAEINPTTEAQRRRPGSHDYSFRSERSGASLVGASGCVIPEDSPASCAEDQDDVPPRIAALMSCPVCLEYMYRPHGLGCGHCMCTTCLLKGNGLDKAVAPSLRALMSHLPFQKGSSGSCPICRQQITEPPIELTALGRLVARTVPDHYNACNKEFKATQNTLKQQLEIQTAAELGLDSNPLFPVFDRKKSSATSGNEQQRPVSAPAAASAER